MALTRGCTGVVDGKTEPEDGKVGSGSSAVATLGGGRKRRMPGDARTVSDGQLWCAASAKRAGRRAPLPRNETFTCSDVGFATEWGYYVPLSENSILSFSLEGDAKRTTLDSTGTRGVTIEVTSTGDEIETHDDADCTSFVIHCCRCLASGAILLVQLVHYEVDDRECCRFFLGRYETSLEQIEWTRLPEELDTQGKDIALSAIDGVFYAVHPTGLITITSTGQMQRRSDVLLLAKGKRCGTFVPDPISVASFDDPFAHFLVSWARGSSPVQIHRIQQQTNVADGPFRSSVVATLNHWALSMISTPSGWLLGVSECQWQRGELVALFLAYHPVTFHSRPITCVVPMRVACCKLVRIGATVFFQGQEAEDGDEPTQYLWRITLPDWLMTPCDAIVQARADFITPRREEIHRVLHGELAIANLVLTFLAAAHPFIDPPPSAPSV